MGQRGSAVRKGFPQDELWGLGPEQREVPRCKEAMGAYWPGCARDEFREMLSTSPEALMGAGIWPEGQQGAHQKVLRQREKVKYVF